MNNKQKLEELAEKEVSAYTSEEKNFITELSDQMGVEFHPSKKCTSCWLDQVVLLRSILKAQESTCSYVLKPGLDFRWNGLRVNNDTLTDEIAERLISEGLPTVLFAKMK